MRADEAPAIVTAPGQRAQLRFLEVFAASIRNAHTRRAQAGAVGESLAWCESIGVALGEQRRSHVVTAPIRDDQAGFALSNREASGRVRIQVFGRSYAATWRIVAGSVEITSELGVGSVALGALASAPSIAAAEKLREMALQANRAATTKPDRARFNVRDA